MEIGRNNYSLQRKYVFSYVGKHYKFMHHNRTLKRKKRHCNISPETRAQLHKIFLLGDYTERFSNLKFTFISILPHLWSFLLHQTILKALN